MIADGGFTVVRVKMGGEELTYETSEKMVPKTAFGAGCMLTD